MGRLPFNVVITVRRAKTVMWSLFSRMKGIATNRLVFFVGMSVLSAVTPSLFRGPPNAVRDRQPDDDHVDRKPEDLITPLVGASGLQRR